MRVLFIGDIFARAGMQVTTAYLEHYATSYDFIIANGENAAGGRGINRKYFNRLRKAGVDVVTLGNHSWDNREALELVEETPHLIRPYNLPAGTPGLGLARFTTKDNQAIWVAQILGRIFMEAMDDPFAALDAICESIPEDEAFVIDMHAEATSEKKLFGFFVRGRASAILGTHTHVQTADEAIYQGTAYISDVGMTGVQDSAIGMSYDEVLYRTQKKLPQRFSPASGAGTLSAVGLELEASKAVYIERIQWTASSENCEN